VRLEDPGRGWFGHALVVLALAGGGVVGGALAGWSGAGGGLALGLGAGLLLRHRLGRRARARARLLATPFPDSARRFLLEAYDHYERLPPALRHRFEDEARVFMAETTVSGIGVPVTDELRLLVAASAVTLSLGWPDHEWDQVTEVLLYPDDFDRDYRVGGSDRAGETHPWGTVILSVPALEESFAQPDDAFHVGIHEFTHLLDLEQTEFGGIPSGLDAARAREWVALVEKEMERLRRGRSVLDDYGADDPVEFLAVAVEAFFEIPQALRRRHHEVYAMLSSYFHQDPAAWDDARGLRE
jgi:Mlc titration factor MtfA (ptsG expression regulator)